MIQELRLTAKFENCLCEDSFWILFCFLQAQSCCSLLVAIFSRVLTLTTSPNKNAPNLGHFYLAEKEGFEPSMSYQPIHEFQSCAINRARRLLHNTDLSVRLRTMTLYAIFGSMSRPFLRKIRVFLPES